MIPLSVPNVFGREREYVLECFDTGWVSSAGPFVGRFEREFAKYVGVKHAVAVCNGTAALHVALVGLGVPADAEIIAPTITFIATLNAIRYCNAEPIFFDCDQDFNIDLAAVERFLSTRCELRGQELINRDTGRIVWGILPTHIFGTPIDMPRVCSLAKRYNLCVIEDAAESLGSRLGGKHTGTFATCGCFSFNGNKIMTTGGGGMVVTDDEQLASHLRYLSTQAKDDPLRFIHEHVGYNYRLTNIQAAFGVAQLECLEQFLESKRRIHRTYREAFKNSEYIELVCPQPNSEANYWLCNVRIKSEKEGVALELVEHLRRKQIEARPIWWPNHLQTPYKNCYFFEISRAMKEVNRVVSIPCSTGLSESQQNEVIEAISEFRPAL